MCSKRNINSFWNKCTFVFSLYMISEKNNHAQVYKIRIWTSEGLMFMLDIYAFKKYSLLYMAMGYKVFKML